MRVLFLAIALPDKCSTEDVRLALTTLAVETGELKEWPQDSNDLYGTVDNKQYHLAIQDTPFNDVLIGDYSDE